MISVRGALLSLSALTSIGFLLRLSGAVHWPWWLIALPFVAMTVLFAAAVGLERVRAERERAKRGDNGAAG